MHSSVKCLTFFIISYFVFLKKKIFLGKNILIIYSNVSSIKQVLPGKLFPDPSCTLLLVNMSLFLIYVTLEHKTSHESPFLKLRFMQQLKAE